MTCQKEPLFVPGSIMKNVLTIAGSDPSGGAGIQADLKTFAARGVYGMSVITALTAQNTTGVQGMLALSPDFVALQIDAVMGDIDTAAWKLGMLFNEDIIRVVADRAKQYQMDMIVLDPVMIAKGGDALLQTEACNALVELLLPICYVITPNHHEAEVLTGMKITSVQDARKAAVAIHALGARHVVVKGGHLPEIENAVDVLYDGQTHMEIRSPRIKTNNTHGTGCTLASAIAAELAKGYEICRALRNAKSYLTTAMIAADHLLVGKGQGPLNHSLGQVVGGN
jgi:hydroxymethylpyrimidine/phosphomethylpyrimidine kinase